MSVFKVLPVLIDYELRKSLTRKRFLVLAAVILLLEVGLYYVLTRLPAFIVSAFTEYAWIIGLLAPSTALIHVLAGLVGTSVSAEEYEAGTADYWFTRPITRLEYFLGRMLGGFVLLIIIVTAYSILSLILSWFVFGPQIVLEALVVGWAVSIVSTLPFFAIGLALGEALRRSTFSTLITGSLLFASILVETYANIVAAIANDQTLLELVKYLPTWAATHLPATAILQSIEASSIRGVLGPFATIIISSENLWMAVANLAIYAAIPVAFAWVRFRYGDVTRKVQ